MNEASRKPKVTLEDLLQVKRTERPAAEFWAGFEQELRAKQLAALVRPPRPWWRGLTSRKLLIRVYAPLSAAAAVALSFSSYERPAVSRVASAVPMAAQPSAVVQIESPSALIPEVENRLADMRVEPVQPEAVMQHEARHDTATESVATANSSTTPDQLLLAGTATVKAAGQALAQMVGLVGAPVETSDASFDAVVEPLAQLATPRDNRRARLLAYSVAYDPHAPASKDSARSRERITRRISDESIYDSISRLGVSGDRVSIKF